MIALPARPRIRIAILLAIAASVGGTLAAETPTPTSGEPEEKKGFWSRLKDPEDGKLDLTAGGDQGAGFFPIVLPFNEPATGPGLALALGYFHPTRGEAPPKYKGAGTPPTTTFGAAAATTNGSWFAAAGHSHVWKRDTIRYLGALGGGSINLAFYGLDDEETGEDDGLDFNIELLAMVQQVKFRVGKSPFFVGGRYAFAATTTTFDEGTPEVITGDVNLAALALLGEYDTRDTVFTPNRGLRATIDLSWFSEALGSDFDYGSLKTKFRYYWPLADSWVLGFRGDYDIVGDEAPFFALSFIKLRGVPVFRYLGNFVVTFEVEPRYKIDERWSVLAFTGAGRAATRFGNLSEAEPVYSFGTGFRYLIARKLGLGVGIDIARGPEETVGYLTVGSAW
jgi:hypothetical protein